MMSVPTAAAGGALLAVLTLATPQNLPVAQADAPLGVRITSPLGRMGIPGKVRIVAQVHSTPGAVLSPVQFFVDGVLLGEDKDGPPFAAEWEDVNPFEPRSLAVAVADDHGNAARDAVALKPLEVVETSEVMSVLLDAAVQDKTGRAIGNLQARDFSVREDGVPQALELVRQETVPTMFALLIDSSQSMSRRMDFVKEAASRLSGYMVKGDRMLVVPFAKQLEAVTGPTNDAATVQQAIAAIAPRGGTAILDGVIALAPHLQNVEGRPAIVLITDGYDENSEKSFDDALQAVKAVHATVYVVGIGGSAGISLKGERLLKKLADETGGRAFLPSREEELPGVHALLAADVHNRYILTYTPTNQKMDGTWRAIAVSTADRSQTVRTRAGYFAPKPPPVRAALEFTLTRARMAVADITADDLSVVEDGVPQAIDTFQEAVTPVSVVLALDSSGSMKKAAETAKAAARGFVAALKPEDKLATVIFSDKAEVAHELSTDRDATLAAIGTYQASGGTALYDALAGSLSRLKDVDGRRVVVVVTDGRDEDNPGTRPGSISTFDAVLADLKQIDAVVYAIGIGAKVDRKVLGTLASVSGGEAYFPEDASGLDEQYRLVIEHLRRRWVIGYTSTNPKRDGAWRHVEITPKCPDDVVKSRGGYLAPGK